MQVKINNWNINYEVIGEGNPVVLLHGWLADLETMRPIANNLSKNFKVYLVDDNGKKEYKDSYKFMKNVDSIINKTEKNFKKIEKNA